MWKILYCASFAVQYDDNGILSSLSRNHMYTSKQKRKSTNLVWIFIVLMSEKMIEKACKSIHQLIFLNGSNKLMICSIQKKMYICVYKCISRAKTSFKNALNRVSKVGSKNNFNRLPLGDLHIVFGPNFRILF